MTRVVVAHAYSSTNSGDGLLVHEALALISEAIPRASVTVLALDPSSFPSDLGCIHPLTGMAETPSRATLVASAALAWLRGARLPKDVRALIASADLVVGVGGGYLRGSNALEAVKMLLSHFPQLEATGRARKTVYLPQSVGPFRAGSSRLVRHRVQKLQTLFVRDDRSADLLRHDSGVVRLPDTALLALADFPPPASARGIEEANIGLVARGLSGPRRRRERYVERLRSLAELTNAEVLLQASARGNDDGAFYRSALGRDQARSLADATSGEDSVDVVVSVRLHGAIQSIRNGVPAVHLSYERKGWGAYEDLGISKFVHNAFDFDETLVARQAASLAEDASEYWAAIQTAQSKLGAARAQIVEALAATA